MTIQQAETKATYIPLDDYKGRDYIPFKRFLPDGSVIGRDRPFCDVCKDYYKRLYDLGLTSEPFMPRCHGNVQDSLPSMEALGMGPEEEEAYNEMAVINDPMKWAEVFFDWKPRWYQVEMLGCTSRYKVVRAGRRLGKTCAISIYSLWYAFTHSHAKVLIVAPYQSQVALIFREIQMYIDQSKILSDSIETQRNSPPITIIFKNGATILGFASGRGQSQHSDQIRGQGADLIVLDEVDMMNDYDIETIMAIRASNATCEVWASSTPRGWRKAFWEWCVHKNLRYREFHYISMEGPEWTQDSEDYYRQTTSKMGFCFDEETEILTDQGWRKHHGLKEGDLVASYNRETKRLNYNPVKSVYRYDHFKELIRCKTESIDLLVTPGHGLYRRSRENGPWKACTAEKAYDKQCRFMKSAEFESEGIPISNAQISFLAWVMAEGHIGKNRKKYVRIAQSDHPDGRLNRLESDLAEANISYTRSLKVKAGKVVHGIKNNHDHYSFYIKGGLPEFFYEYMDTQKTPLRSLSEMSSSQCRVFLRTYIDADGNYDKRYPANDGGRISSNRKDHIDFIQEIVVRAGWRSTISQNSIGQWYLSFTPMKDTHIGKESWSRERYDGIVWCVAVDDGTLLVRRNGKHCITMNTHEYLAEFGEEAFGVFKAADVDEALYDYKLADITHTTPVGPMIMGVDWNLNSGTHITIVEWTGSVYKLVHKVVVPKSEFTQTEGVKKIKELNKLWGPRFIYVDEGYGSTQIEMIKAAGLEEPSSGLYQKIKPVTMARSVEITDSKTGEKIQRQSKQFMVELTARRVEDHIVMLPREEDTHVIIEPDDPDNTSVGLIQQMRNFRVIRESVTGQPIYSQEYEHTLTALMLCILGFQMEFGGLTRTHYATKTADGPPIGENPEKIVSRSGGGEEPLSKRPMMPRAEAFSGRRAVPEINRKSGMGACYKIQSGGGARVGGNAERKRENRSSRFGKKARRTGSRRTW